MIGAPQETTDGISVWRLIVLGAVTALGPLSIDLYLPAFPELAAEMHSSEAAVQLTLTFCIVGLALGQLIAGPLSDAVGRRAPIVFGLVGWSVASVLCALAPSIATLSALRFAQGLAGSAGVVVARAVIRDLASGDELTRAFSRLMLVIGVVPIAAPTLGGLMLKVTDWRGIFIALGVIGTLITIVVMAGLQESLPAHLRRRGGVRHSLESYRQLLLDQHFVASSLVVALTFSALFTYVGTSSFVLRDVYHLSPAQYGLVFGANSVALILGTQVSGWLIGRVPSTVLLPRAIMISLVAAVLLLVFGVSGLFGFYGVGGPLFVMVFGIGLAMPIASSRAMNGHPERAGAASALLGVFQFGIGGVVVPIVGTMGSSSVVPLATAMALSLVLALAVNAASTMPRVRDEVPEAVSV